MSADKYPSIFSHQMVTIVYLPTDTEVNSCFSIQLFRQRLSCKSVKAYATMPIGIMGRKSLALID